MFSLSGELPYLALEGRPGSVVVGLDGDSGAVELPTEIPLASNGMSQTLAFVRSRILDSVNA